MAQGSIRQRNPFLLMLQPEAVLAAMARSEKLGRLARHSCHPLDKPVLAPANGRKARGIDLDEDDAFHGFR